MFARELPSGNLHWGYSVGRVTLPEGKIPIHRHVKLSHFISLTPTRITMFIGQIPIWFVVSTPQKKYDNHLGPSHLRLRGKERKLARRAQRGGRGRGAGG